MAFPLISTIQITIGVLNLSLSTRIGDIDFVGLFFSTWGHQPFKKTILFSSLYIATIDVKRNIFDLCTDTKDCYLAVIEVKGAPRLPAFLDILAIVQYGLITAACLAD